MVLTCLAKYQGTHCCKHGCLDLLSIYITKIKIWWDCLLWLRWALFQSSKCLAHKDKIFRECNEFGFQLTIVQAGTSKPAGFHLVTFYTDHIHSNFPSLIIFQATFTVSFPFCFLLPHLNIQTCSHIYKYLNVCTLTWLHTQSDLPVEYTNFYSCLSCFIGWFFFHCVESTVKRGFALNDQQMKLNGICGYHPNMYDYSAIVSFWEVLERYWWRDILLFGKTLGSVPGYGFYLEGKIARGANTCQCMDYSLLLS